MFSIVFAKVHSLQSGSTGLPVTSSHLMRSSVHPRCNLWLAPHSGKFLHHACQLIGKNFLACMSGLQAKIPFRRAAASTKFSFTVASFNIFTESEMIFKISKAPHFIVGFWPACSAAACNCNFMFCFACAAKLFSL
jgi:hypothetical protein